MISFEGNYKNPAFIKKRCSFKPFKEITTSFVELNPSSREDRLMLRKISRSWRDGTAGGTYAVEISETFDNAYLHALENLKTYHAQELEKNSDRFFAITTQKQDFDNLNPDKVLGLAKTTKEEDNSIWLDFLQGNPDNNYNSEFRNYKKVGSAIITSLKAIFKGKRIELLSDFDAIPFYEKLGFVKVKNSEPNHFYIEA